MKIWKSQSSSHLPAFFPRMLSMELVTDPKLLIAPDGRTETQTRLRRGRSIHWPLAALTLMDYSLVICYSLLLKMAIEIVDFPIKNGDFTINPLLIPMTLW